MPAAADTHPRGVFASLLQTQDEPKPANTALQFGLGLGLAAVFGLALGTRAGGAELWQHALYVPLGIAAVFLLGVPAFYIGMSIIDAPVQPRSLLSASGASITAIGAILAGLAPMTALYVTTTDGIGPVQILSSLALALAGVLGLRTLIRAVNQQVRQTDGGRQILAFLLSTTFFIFAALFATRFWMTTLPILGGAS